MNLKSAARTLFVLSLFSVAAIAAAHAAETTGSIVGRIVGASGEAVSQAVVTAVSPSGRYDVRSDPAGRFTLASVTPDTYIVSVAAAGYESKVLGGVSVFPGRRIDLDVTLQRALKTIASVKAKAGVGIVYGEPRDVFRISGGQARGPAVSAGSGLATYTQGTIQSALAAVPGVQQDQYSNAIVRGGKVEDVVFSYDAVPVPQALIAEPGGNVIGAQLPTTGVGYTSVTTAGSPNGADSALAAQVDQIVLTGTYPAQSTLTIGQGIFPGARDVEYESRFASPDLRQRYAIDARSGSRSIAYGDGTTFYPAEAATFGLSLQSRALWSVEANVHFKVGNNDDLELLSLGGQAVYDQYGTPFPGETYGAFDGSTIAFPGEPSPGAFVNTPSRIRGTYAVEKVQYVRNYRRGYARVRFYRSLYGSQTLAPFFDDLSFPNGVVSYAGTQYQNLTGFGLDAKSLGEKHEGTYGIELRGSTSGLDQVVPTLDQRVTANPNLSTFIAYVSNRFLPSEHLTIEPGLRYFDTYVHRSDNRTYGIVALDAHLSGTYRLGAQDGHALRVAFDHATALPQPLEVERNDTELVGAPFTPLAPERANSFEVSYQHAGKTSLQLTYFYKHDKDRIDVIPQDYRTPGSAISNPATGIGIPQNVGELITSGFELALQRGDFSLAATTVRGFSSSASQFGLNDLNAPAIAVHHLFPIGYVPPFSAVASYRVHLGRTTVTPAVSYESGYPYGNGKMAWIYDANGNPIEAPNDNHVNPGYNYYFLRDPSKAFDPVSNPYIGSLGTPEGNDPNTLRSKPMLLFSLHVETPLSRRASLILDLSNVFGTASATQLVGNPYLIGPPGYTGGNSLYEAYYGKVFGAGTAYTLGNGVPTNDGRTPAVPWAYGTAAYVPSSYPEARSAEVYIRWQLP